MRVKSIFVLLFISFLVSTSFSQTAPRCPCCGENNNDFNFWIGEWDVYNAAGMSVGTNSIVSLQDSCLIQENWASSTSVFRGTSYNFFNQNSKKWQQVWIDNRGGKLLLEGELVNGEMVLVSKEIANPRGEKTIDRIKWTPYSDGSVRQLWEQSTDRGSKWTIAFEGLYKRTKND